MTLATSPAALSSHSKRLDSRAGAWHLAPRGGLLGRQCMSDWPACWLGVVRGWRCGRGLGLGAKRWARKACSGWNCPGTLCLEGHSP